MKEEGILDYIFNFFIPEVKANPLMVLRTLETLWKLTKHMKQIGFSKPMRRKILEKIPKNNFNRCEKLKFKNEKKGNKGFRLYNEGGGDALRIMEKSRMNKQYVKISRNGQVIGKDGNPIINNQGKLSSLEESHIPIEEWLSWKSWHSKF